MAYVQVYTGNGKGKTTAAIGLAMRALGAGKRVYFLQFMKGKQYSEHNTLRTVSPDLTLVSTGKPYFIVMDSDACDEIARQYGDSCVVFEKGNPPPEYVRIVNEAMDMARDAASSGDYDLVVFDELNCALHFGLVSFEEVRDLIDKRAGNTELVFTGRGAPDELIEIADLVTEFKEIKHYYNQGVMARKGIEM